MTLRLILRIWYPLLFDGGCFFVGRVCSLPYSHYKTQPPPLRPPDAVNEYAVSNPPPAQRAFVQFSDIFEKAFLN